MHNRIVKRIFKGIYAAGAMGVISIATAAFAQTNAPVPAGPPFPPPAGPAVIAQRPAVVPPASAPTIGNQPDRPERPPVPGRPQPAKEVKDLVKDFQTARQDFIRRQQDLNRQLKGATSEQRAAIRAQLKESLNAWLEDQKAHLQELREQAKEIKNRVPAIKDVIDSGGGEGRGR